MSGLTMEVTARHGSARAGTVTTPRGSFATPCFMPVGTRGAVRTLSATDLETVGARVVLANTYHLMLRPGAEVVAGLGGLGRFMGWDGHLLTDSGGYQVFSLRPEVDDGGVTFASTYDGSRHRLSPEGAVATQATLGADITMTLDVCPALPAADEVVADAVERTARWAERARAAFLADPGSATGLDPLPGDHQVQFGIVQGGTHKALRARSARQITGIGFDGYAVGGLSVGESRDEMLPALEATLAELPTDQPRYLMGIGDPVGLVEAVAAGVDLFDCVLPTRLARHGTVLTSTGRYHLSNARYATDDQALDPSCGCAVCGRWSRGYLRHLANVGEPGVARLVTLHNVTWLIGLVDRMGAAIADGTFDGMRAEVAEHWS